MTVDKAKNELRDINYFCKYACNMCTANDWYCPTECDTLQKARRIGFENIVKSYARNDGDWAKVFRYINQTKSCKRKTGDIVLKPLYEDSYGALCYMDCCGDEGKDGENDG